jgi:hypothetical protein
LYRRQSNRPRTQGPSGSLAGQRDRESSLSGCGGQRPGTASAPLNITAGILPTAYIGQPYLTTIHAFNGQPPYTFSMSPATGVLPPGLTLSPSGSITGTPTTITNPSFMITVTDSVAGLAQRAFNLPTVDSLAISTTSQLPAASLGIQYSSMVSFSGGIAPYSFAISSGLVPPGLQLNASTGNIAGTPTSAGNYSFTVQLTDGGGATSSSLFSLSVSSNLVIVPSTPLPGGVVGSQYSVPFSAQQGTPPCSWRSTGNPPPGITFNTATAVLSGTPTQGVRSNSRSRSVTIPEPTRRLVVRSP